MRICGGCCSWWSVVGLVGGSHSCSHEVGGRFGRWAVDQVDGLNKRWVFLVLGGKGQYCHLAVTSVVTHEVFEGHVKKMGNLV